MVPFRKPLLTLLFCAVWTLVPQPCPALPVAGPESVMGLAAHRDSRDFVSSDRRTHVSFALPVPDALAAGNRFRSNLAEAEIAVTREIGRAFLSTAYMNWPYGSQHTLSASLAAFDIQFQSGRGDGMIADRLSASDMAPNFFHGSVAYPYTYAGTILEYAGVGDLRLHAGAFRIASDAMETRAVYEAGVSHPLLSGSYSRVMRGNAPVGHRFGLAIRHGVFSVGYQEMVSRRGPGWRDIGIEYHPTDGKGTLLLNLGIGRSDLYEASDTMRFTLAWSMPWEDRRHRGRQRPRNAAGSADTGLASAAQRFSARSRTGAGIVGTGLALTSGSGVLDATPRFQTQHAAAYYVLSAWNPVSVENNREYAGSLYRNRDGAYSPSARVVRGTATSVTFNPAALVPAGTVGTAFWHTHGDDIPGYLNEQFSPADLSFAVYYDIDGYLGTPAGRMFLFDVSTLRVHQFVDGDRNEMLLPH